MESQEKERYTDEIESYHGVIPAWLVVVIIVLALWGIYYLVEYWNGPGSNF